MPKLKQLDSTKPKALKESSAKDNDRNGPASKDREEDLQPLSDAECILATTRVKGFDLRTKEWGTCYDGRLLNLVDLTCSSRSRLLRHRRDYGHKMA